MRNAAAKHTFIILINKSHGDITRCKWWKKVNGNWDIINKNGHSTFHTGKPANFNSLREVFWIVLWHCYLEIDCRVSAKKGVMVISILQMICIGHVLEAPGLYQQTLFQNCTGRFYKHSIRMRSCLLKNNFKFNLQKHRFAYGYQVIIKCYINLIICLYFPLALITWNSSHCHQMEL